MYLKKLLIIHKYYDYINETAKATINLGSENSVSLSVLMLERREDEMIFQPRNISMEIKQKIATSLAKEDDKEISVNLSVLVGRLAR